MTTGEDPKVGELLQREADDSTRAVLIGFPCDEGVKRNGGRPGAAEGPEAIRRALAKLTPDTRNFEAHVSLLGHTADLGDLHLVGDLSRDQEKLASEVAKHLEQGRNVIVLGGGHETAYGHVLGHFESGLETHILNWDAHPDVRPLVGAREADSDDVGLPHSGSPFRQALEHPSGRCRSYTVAGLEPWCVAASHVQFLSDRKDQACNVVWRDELDQRVVHDLYSANRENSTAPPSLVTFDLDALPATVAPGVSAPNGHGMELDLWLMAARLAGETETVRSIDVVELSPRHDLDSRTARVAALTVWHFLAGLSRRYSM